MEVQGVGQQLQPGQGGHPERGGERFGRERRHQRCPLPTQGFLRRGTGPGRPVSDQVTNPDSAVAGCSTHHCAATRSLASAGLAFPDLGLGGEVEQPLRVEVSDLDRSCRINIVSNMSQSKQTAPTFRPRNRG